MYEIIMTTGDRAEADSISACLTAAATLAEDSGWGDVTVAETFYAGLPTRSLTWTLKMHVTEARAAARENVQL